MTSEFIRAIYGKTPAHTVTVTWTNGTRATYSAHMADLLKTDPTALEIMDNETGEIIYMKE